jgi:hypothetical protein
MAGLKGNNAWWMFQRQTEKGTVATVKAPSSVKTETVGAFKQPFSGGNIEPNRVFGKLAETDASRNVGVSYAKVGGVKGNPEGYVRDDWIGSALQGVLGLDAVVAAEPNYTHTITPQLSIPYFTFWKMQSEVLYERYKDCIFSSLQIKTTPGEPLVATSTILGLESKRLTSDPSTSPAISLDKATVYNFNNATTTLGGAETKLISSFDLTLNNAATAQQTDSFTPLDAIAGIFTVDLTFDLVLENIEQYEKFNYESSGGFVNESNKLYETSFKVKFELGANNLIEFTIPKLAYETFVVSPNVTGAPIVVSVKGIAQRVGAGENIIEAKVKNQISAY